MTSTPATGTLGERHLRVLIADENKDALHTLHTVLAGLGHDVTPYAVSVNEAAELIAREDPQVAIVVMHHDDEHALALIGEAVEYASGPVIAQLHGADVDFLSRATGRARPASGSCRWPSRCSTGTPCCRSSEERDVRCMTPDRGVAPAHLATSAVQR